MGSLMILQRAREAGLEVRARGDRLVVRGPRKLEALARVLLDHKTEVLRELARGGPSHHSATRPRGGVPLEELFPDLRGEGDPPSSCWACHSRSWWRLVHRRSCGPWVCERCHPPQVGEAPIERFNREGER